MQRLRLIHGVALWGLLTIGWAQAASPSVESFFRDPDISEAVLSPSGRKLAITTAARGEDRVGLAIVDLSPGGKAARIVQFNDADVRHVHWVNEDRLLLSAIDLSDGSGRPNGAWGLFAVNADGSKMRQFVRRFGKPFVTSGDSQQLLDWNHVLLKVPAPKPDAANEEVLLAQFATDESGREDPIRLNVRTGTTRELDFKTPPNVVGWLMDSSGDPRVVFTRVKELHAAYWRAPGSTTWEKLYENKLLEAPFRVQDVDDAGTLYVTHNVGPEQLQVLSRYDFERKAPETKPLVSTPGFDFNGHLITEPSSAKALGVRVTVDGEATVWFDPAMKAFQDKTDRQLPGKVNRITCRRCGQPDMVALVRSYSDHDPGQLWLYLAQPGEGDKHWRPIGKVMNGVTPTQMAGMELQRIKARDGRDLPVWVTRPDGATGPLPAVVLVHGGPWLRGSAWGWHDILQFLASRGYAVIEPEFRGSTGFGETHFKAGWKQWGQAMQDDVADALLWAQKQGIASQKACIAGASYGGYSTLMGLVRHPELYRCGVAWLAVTDLDLLLQGSWWVSDDATQVMRRYTLPEMIGDATKDAAMIAANSPVKQAARIKAPVLLASGEADRRVPLAHGKRMRDALKDAGNPPEWVSYPGEGHGFALLKNRVDFAQRMEAFLAKHLAAP